MIYLETGDLYYNTQVYFRKNLMDDLPNDDKAWKKAYHTWLETQGVVIVISSKDLIRNALGVAPGYDMFGFENEHDATMFVLKWS
jgi:hypothetical protein